MSESNLPPSQQSPPSMARRRTVEASTLGVGLVLAVLLLGLVNYFAWKYYKQFDWTSSEIYTLSEKTKNVVGSLTQPVEVVVFTGPGVAMGEQSLELLERYRALSPQLRLREVDPIKNLSEAERLLERYATHYQEGTVKVVFDNGASRRIFEEDDLAEYDYSPVQMGGPPTVTGFKGEAVFTGALVELASGERPTILFTVGHGEKKLDDFSGNGLRGVQELLGRDNVTMEEWASLGKQVPEATSLIVVAGPRGNFSAPELEAFTAYLDGGGRMLWLLDPALSAIADLQAAPLGDWLAGYGIELGEDLVVDPDQALPFFGADTFFVNAYGSHPVILPLAETQTAVILALARSVTASNDETPGRTRTELLETSSGGWGETSLERLPEVEAEETDLLGPVSLAVAVEEIAPEAGPDDGSSDSAPAGEKSAGMRMIVFGDSDFAADNQIGNQGNAALIDNAINWLLERDTLLGIPPKKPEQVRLSLTRQQLWRTYLLTALLPLLAIVAGMVVYFKRRR